MQHAHKLTPELQWLAHVIDVELHFESRQTAAVLAIGRCMGLIAGRRLGL
jgi:hypothetical protein